MVAHMTHTSTDGSVLDGRCGDRSGAFQLVQTSQHIRQRRTQTNYFVALFQHLLLQVRDSFSHRFIFSLDHVIPSVDDSADCVPWRLHGDDNFDVSAVTTLHIHIVSFYTAPNTLTSFTRKDEIFVSILSTFDINLTTHPLNFI